MPNGKPEGLRPTVFDPSAVQSPPDSAQTTRRIGSPTVIPGVERKRFVISYDDLQVLMPGLTDSVYEKAIELLSSLIIEKVSDRDAILWGHDIQTSYSGLVNQTLKLSQRAVLRKVQGYLSRMIDLLGSIDILAVCGYDSRGFFEQLTKSMNQKIDTPDDLIAAQRELALLVKHLSSSLDELLNLKALLEDVSNNLNLVAEEMEAAAVAALFLASFYSGTSIADRFTERSMNLTQTLAQMRQDEMIRKIQIDQPLLLISTIQNIVLVSLPGFIGSITSIVTLMQSRTVSPTEAGEVVYQLQEIVNNLQSTP